MTSRRQFLCLAAASRLAVSAHATGARTVVAQTRAGRIGGVRDHGVHVSKGVPFGADTKTRRFLPPSAAIPWQRVLDALDYGPACPQPDANEAVSEDCLSSNV